VYFSAIYKCSERFPLTVTGVTEQIGTASQNRVMPTTTSSSTTRPPLGALATAKVCKQPGHWVLASLGKKVLRPGGLELTTKLLEKLQPSPADHVVEFAPGLGVTARLTLAKNPRRYVGIEREAAMMQHLQHGLGSDRALFVNASAESTGLPNESATLVYGEAMLSMQTPEQKVRILREAYLVLKPGGRYGIHELALLPDDIDDATRKAIEREMSLNIHVGVRPVTLREWRQLLECSGFEVEWETRAPTHLLEPKRVLRDEGILGLLRIAFNLLRKPEARKRVLSMKRMFRRHANDLSAVAIVCRKPL